MLRLAIVGATGRTGREIVKRALEAGHAVKALHRGRMPSTTSERLRWIAADIDDADKLRQLVEDVDVVISAIGPRPGRLSDTCSTASAALIAAGARRLVVVSGMALDLPGDQKGFVGRIAARIVRALSRKFSPTRSRRWRCSNPAASTGPPFAWACS